MQFCKIVCTTSWCEWLFVTHSLAIIALTRTGINQITSESSSYPYRSFSMLNLSVVNPNSPSSLILTTYILWLQQTQTAEREVFHPIMTNRPLTLWQNPQKTEYHQNSVSIQLVYRIQRSIFIHYQPQSRFEPIYHELSPLMMVATLFSRYVLQDYSTRLKFFATQSRRRGLN
jgi:hypothetical protein